MNNTEVKKKIGTPKTEQIIGSGVAKLERLITDASKIGTQFNELIKLANEQSLKIVEAEQKLADINTQAAETKRRLTVENEIAYKENQEAFVNQFLQANQSTAVSRKDYDELTTKVKQLETEQTKETEKAVAIVTNTLKRNYEQDLKLKEQEYIAKEATNTATINQLKEKVSFLEEQVKLWKGALDSERQASVERAKANAVGAINLSAGK